MNFTISKLSPLILGIFAIITMAGVYWYTLPDKLSYEFGKVERRDVINVISVTGRVVPVEKIKLAFEVVGRMETIAVKVGDRVRVGSFLAAQDNQELKSELREQYAEVKVKEAELAELQRGSREEEIRVDEVTVSNKLVSLEDARKDLSNKIRDAFTKTDDAVRNHIDQLYREPRSNPQLDKFNIADFALRFELENKRSSIEQLLKNWNMSLAALFTDESVLDAAREAKDNLHEITVFLDRVAFMVNGLQDGSNLTQSTIDGYKADIATARTNVNTATVNLATAEEKVRSALSALALAEEELALTKAGTSAEDIDASTAQLERAIAKVSTIEAQLAKKTLYSPINGIVAAVEFKEKEIVAANAVIITILSDAMFEVETNVPEVDIVGVIVGKEASITLDAYGRNEIFKAIVAKIDPAETILEGVATYQTTLHLLTPDVRIKSGMTANVDILSEIHTNVIAVPRRAVIKVDNKDNIRVQRNNIVVDVPVILGLRGSDGFVEIIEGVKEGEDIVVFVKEN